MGAIKTGDNYWFCIMCKICLLTWNALHGNALFYIAIIKDSVHHRNIFSLYHQELQRLMGIRLSQRLHPPYGIWLPQTIRSCDSIVTLLKLYWKHACSKKCIQVNYHLRYKYIYSLICYTLWDGSGMRVLLIWLFSFWSLFHFSFFIGFVIFSSLFIVFSAPRFRQLDILRFISLYYYYYYSFPHLL